METNNNNTIKSLADASEKYAHTAMEPMPPYSTPFTIHKDDFIAGAE